MYTRQSSRISDEGAIRTHPSGRVTEIVSEPHIWNRDATAIVSFDNQSIFDFWFR